jgi:hypothetical protein
VLVSDIIAVVDQQTVQSLVPVVKWDPTIMVETVKTALLGIDYDKMIRRKKSYCLKFLDPIKKQ